MSEDLPERKLVYIQDYLPIPPLLYSTETDGPFQRCIECQGRLLEEGSCYVIQKVIRRGETVMEMALCMQCHDNLMEEYSHESQMRLWDFFLDRADFKNRRRRLRRRKQLKLEHWIETCLTCKAPLKTQDEYVICAQCDGHDLLFYYLPYMLCEPCILKINEGLSEKTKDVWGRWKSRHFPGPPSFEQDPTRSPGILM